MANGKKIRSMTGKTSVSVNMIYQLAEEGFRHELASLLGIAKTREFAEVLPEFATFSGMSERHKQDKYSHLLTARPAASSEHYDIDGSHPDLDTEELFLYANLATACGCFAGKTIDLPHLDEKNPGAVVESLLADLPADKNLSTIPLSNKLNCADSLRVCQILKFLGLLDTESNLYRHLALGAFTGDRDIEYMHHSPFISALGPCGPDTSFSDMPPLTFGVVPSPARDIVIVDNEPSFKKLYERLNSARRDHVRAINMDTSTALEVIEDEIGASALAPRNLISIFRLEPAMIPDVNRFFSLLSKVIDEQAIFFVTIGAGDDNTTFADRIRLMGEIHTWLSDRELETARIKLYQGENLEQARINPLFGTGYYASYEILWARLAPDTADPKFVQG